MTLVGGLNWSTKKLTSSVAGKSNLAYSTIKVFSLTARLKDQLIQVGEDEQGKPFVDIAAHRSTKGQRLASLPHLSARTASVAPLYCG